MYNVLKTKHVRRTLKLLALFFAYALIIQGCEEVTPIPDPGGDGQGSGNTGTITESVIEINQFIKTYMEAYYLWNEEMPDIDYKKQPNSFDYFDSLLYKIDIWSDITDDYEALANQNKGISESVGLLFVLKNYSNSEGVFGIIEYVYPDSPADRAMLKRGDFFTAVDGIDLDLDNYNDLLDNSSYTLTMAELKGNIVTPTHDVSLMAEVITENPILYYDTLDVNGNIIGYLVYKNYLLNYNDSVTKVFNWFKEAGIDEMVLDLRYNNGGVIESMQHICSILAPMQQIVRQDVIINEVYNDAITKYRKSKGWTFETCFKDVSLNLNLGRLYILTGRYTASASEATIIGLNPYMDIVTIGEQTQGKYTGAYIIPDPEEKHNWAISPIVLKYSNSNGFTDFPLGLEPTFEGDDDYFHPLGNRNEGLLSLALEKITGEQTLLCSKSVVINQTSVTTASYDGNRKRKHIPLIKREGEVLFNSRYLNH